MREGKDDAMLAARRSGAGQSGAENGREVNVGSVVKSMGLVFGDIGTSPIYTLAVIFLTTPPTEQNILGVLSLIIWTLILIITGQCARLAMSPGRKGGGYRAPRAPPPRSSGGDGLRVSSRSSASSAYPS
jgi:hypothetical protein